MSFKRAIEPRLKDEIDVISGCVQTIAIIGPVFGYLLGSLCAKIYVDVGFVDMGECQGWF